MPNEQQTDRDGDTLSNGTYALRGSTNASQQ